MIPFLVGCICGAVGIIMILFIYASLMGGDNDE